MGIFAYPTAFIATVFRLPERLLRHFECSEKSQHLIKRFFTCLSQVQNDGVCFSGCLKIIFSLSLYLHTPPKKSLRIFWRLPRRYFITARNDRSIFQVA
ncbi:MAG: hypothetical protein J6M43_01370 [Neisseriaceae bacterium]|nr:hypothetical protein [Neisseriaceae bacterium]